MNNVPEDWVRLGKNVCEICGKLFDSGEILLHKNLQSIPEDKTVTGWGVCPEDQKMLDDGFVALVEVRNSESDSRKNLQQHEANRSGNIAWLKREAFAQVFEGVDSSCKMAFVDMGVIEKLQSLVDQGSGS